MYKQRIKPKTKYCRENKKHRHKNTRKKEEKKKGEFKKKTLAILKRKTNTSSIIYKKVFKSCQLRWASVLCPRGNESAAGR